MASISACQQQLADLLGSLDATVGLPEEDRATAPEPQRALAQARRAVEETLHRLDGVASVEPLEAQLTEFEERVWRRLVEAMRADSRRVEAAVQAEVAALRGDVESVRREHATVAAELRDARTRDAAARSTELATLDKGIARLEADLRRLMATIDDRILHQVRRARIGIDEEMAALRTWVESTIAASTGGVWSALVTVVRDPMTIVTTVAGLLPRRLFG